MLVVTKFRRNYTVSHKKSQLFACYNSETCERILIFIGRNVTDKVSNQKTLYYATSSNLCFCTTWKTGKHENCIFHSNAVLVYCLNATNQLLDFFNLIDSRLILTMLYDSLNLVINAFSWGLFGGMVQDK